MDVIQMRCGAIPEDRDHIRVPWMAGAMFGVGRCQLSHRVMSTANGLVSCWTAGISE